jgi:hypothetical protein
VHTAALTLQTAMSAVLLVLLRVFSFLLLPGSLPPWSSSSLSMMKLASTKNCLIPSSQTHHRMDYRGVNQKLIEVLTQTEYLHFALSNVLLMSPKGNAGIIN